MELNWRSACSMGSCVEVAWKTSSFCSTGGCVQVGQGDGWVLVRDSKNPDRPALSYRPQTWSATVLAPVMLGRIPGAVHDVPDGYEWRGHTVEGDEHALTFTLDEWEAFEKGIRRGEFNPEALSR
jgi:hypothetical protein